MWVISIQICLICISVVKGSRPSKDPKVTGKRTNGISYFVWNGATFHPEAKMTAFSLWWGGVLIPRLAMMTWKYTLSMNMCLWVQLAEIIKIKIKSLATLQSVDQRGTRIYDNGQNIVNIMCILQIWHINDSIYGKCRSNENRKKMYVWNELCVLLWNVNILIKILLVFKS